MLHAGKNEGTQCGSFGFMVANCEEGKQIDGFLKGRVKELCPLMCGVCTTPTTTITITTGTKTTTTKTTLTKTTTTSTYVPAYCQGKRESSACGLFGFRASDCSGKTSMNGFRVKDTCPVLCGVCEQQHVSTVAPYVSGRCNGKQESLACGYFELKFSHCIKNNEEGETARRECPVMCGSCRAPTSTVTTVTTTTKAPRPLTIVSTNLMLPALFENPTGEVAVGAGSFVFNGKGGLTARNADQPLVPALQKHWTVSLDFRQTVNTRGYLFAKTNGDGTKRFYSLYSTTNRVTFYYTRGSQMLAAHFRVTVNNGQRHRLVVGYSNRVLHLKFESPAATLHIKRTIGTAPEDCDDTGTNCVLSIGARASLSGTGKYYFTGEMHRMLVVSNKLVLGFPGVPTKGASTQGRQVTNLLDPVYHDAATAASATGTYAFRGSSGNGLRMRNYDGFSETWTIGLDVNIFTGGYLFAKTDASGQLRHYSLYVSSQNKDVVFYYSVQPTPLLPPVLQMERFAVNIADRAEYQLVLALDGDDLSLVVDGVLIGGTRKLVPNRVKDCGKASSNCVFYTGQRVRRGYHPSPA